MKAAGGLGLGLCTCIGTCVHTSVCVSVLAHGSLEWLVRKLPFVISKCLHFEFIFAPFEICAFLYVIRLSKGKIYTGKCQDQKCTDV